MVQRVGRLVCREKRAVWKIRPSRVLYHLESDFVETSAGGMPLVESWVPTAQAARPAIPRVATSDEKSSAYRSDSIG